ncbi:hypothetical protein PFWH6_1754 [Pseudomonas fluorescens WH6]|nr:hypothetical protein PFWH6_1754 [Pseudomonas fluorescens WH6]
MDEGNTAGPDGAGRSSAELPFGRRTHNRGGQGTELA